MNNEFKQLLLERFDIAIQDEALYVVAFTHSSYANEFRQKDLAYNERIEFLGDAVLELATSNFLYKKFPELNEGQLTKFRAVIVCEESLSKLAIECGFDRFIRLGRGEEKAGGRQRQALLCDLFESFIGALYLDLGNEAVEKFLEKVVYPKVLRGEFPRTLDSKTSLQELLQSQESHNIEYRVDRDEGPSHDKTFFVSVLNNNRVIGSGFGQSKKTAEQSAAWDALKRIQKP